MHVYALRSNQTDKIYIGSTVKPLENRFNSHKYFYAKYLKDTENNIFCTPFNILKFEDCYIDILNTYENITLEELKQKENEYINTHKNICVNKNNAYDTNQERRETQKKFQSVYKKGLKTKHKVCPNCNCELPDYLNNSL